MRICEVDRCERKHSCKGYCSTHYSRMQRGHEVTAKTRYDRTLTERFWEKVDKRRGRNACWMWTGSVNKKGYGHFRVGGFIYKAARWAWEQEHGPIDPPALTIDHVVCGQTGCVRPSHMELVTRAENTKRARAKRKALAVVA